MPAPDQSRPPGWLDGVETIVSTIYLALLGVVAIAAIGGMAYLLVNRPAWFGSQGEWFYIGGGFLLVMFWVVAQAMSILRRLQRQPMQSRELPGPQITPTPDGFSFTWGAPTATENKPSGKRWSWQFQAAPPLTRTFAIDRAQLAAARVARASGKSWKEIAQQLNAEYADLGVIEQALYEQALQHAVDQTAAPAGDQFPEASSIRKPTETG